jgi:hypothetical protein
MMPGGGCPPELAERPVVVVVDSPTRPAARAEGLSRCSSPPGQSRRLVVVAAHMRTWPPRYRGPPDHR